MYSGRNKRRNSGRRNETAGETTDETADEAMAETADEAADAALARVGLPVLVPSDEELDGAGPGKTARGDRDARWKKEGARASTSDSVSS